MYLTHLSLTDFRIFSRFDQDLPRKALILAGDNAQGKTSLLEAVYYLSTLVSFQASNTVNLINFFALQEDLAGNHATRKEVLLDGSQLKVNAAIGQFNAVLFLPQMLQVLTGSPQRRRHYLDLTLSQVDSHYRESLTEFTKALVQRNALLKQLNEQSSDPEQLAFWDEQITQAGAYLMFSRIQAVRELGFLAASIHQELTRGEEILRLNYLPSYEPLEPPPGQMAMPLDSPADRSGLALPDIEDGYRENIIARHSEDILRGMTSLGPHRDELRFLSNGIDLGNFGSRGQLRTALLALKLAEVNWLKGKNGDWPVLLLDEVAARTCWTGSSIRSRHC